MKLNKISLVVILTMMMCSQAVRAESIFLDLKDKYNRAGAVNLEDVSGERLGRCFSADSNEPHGMILSVRTSGFTVRDHAGPAYPPISYSVTRMGVFYMASDFTGKLTELSASTNDTRDQYMEGLLEKAWKKIPLNEQQLAFKDGVAVASNIDINLGQNVVMAVKKGAEGYLYLESKLESSANAGIYCYFWRKW